ncbi:MAG: hypothetical protein ACOC1L_02725 [Bacillota bacterium]
MIKKIVIKNDKKTLFKGNIMNMPVKKDAIIKESIELFDDDDPCIIHTSFIVKKFAERINTLYNSSEKSIIVVNDYPQLQEFLDVEIDDKTVIDVIK